MTGAHTTGSHRHEGRLTITTDHVGEQPIYFTMVASRWECASSIEDLLALRATPPEADPEHVARMLTGNQVLSTATPYGGIRVALPGTVTELTDGYSRPRVTQWWIPPQPDEQWARASDADLAHGFRSALDAAVKSRVSETTGLELSGGLDSSSLAVLASQFSRGLPSFFWDSEDSTYSAMEAPYIAAVADAASLRHSTSRHTSDEVVLQANPLRRHWPLRPQGSRQSMFQEAAEQGLTTLISGWGGDQCASFTGGQSVIAHLLSRRWQAAGDRLRECLPSPRGTLRRLGSPVGHRMLAYSDAATLARICAGGPLRSRVVYRLTLQARPFTPGPEAQRRWHLFNGHLQPRMQLDQWLARRHGLSYSYPLLDRQLLEWCLKVPAARWWQSGRPRQLFREAVSDLLPEPSLQRDVKLLDVGEREPGQTRLVATQAIGRNAASPAVRHWLPGLATADLSRLSPGTLLDLHRTTAWIRAAMDEDTQ